MESEFPQRIAAETMEDLRAFIEPGQSEEDIALFAAGRMKARGATSWWYHNVPALVLIGARSALSISGRDYHADRRSRVQSTDVVTLDLSPAVKGLWGDYARTIIVEDGRVIQDGEIIKNDELRQGVETEQKLHAIFKSAVGPSMTYEEVFIMMNRHIDDLGYINLDYKKNLGHSIELDEKDRIYVERGNTHTIASYGKPLTFEPHIMRAGGSYGFKWENIYVIEGEHLQAL